MINKKTSFTLIAQRIPILALVGLLFACGGSGGSDGGGSGGGSGGGGGTGGTTGDYTVGGTVVGLASGMSLQLQNNGADTLTINSNGPFTFATKLNSSDSYSVTVSTQPANGQVCALIDRSSGSSTASGTAYSNIDTVRVNCAAVFTFAGSGVGGLGDATGQEAVFNGPSGIAIDSNGNFYVADKYNYAIRKITSAGVVTTLAGSGVAGYTDGTGAAAQFRFDPYSRAGVAVDSADNVYVADTFNDVIRKISPAGVVTTLAGSGVSGYNDATGSAAQFNEPQGVAVDTSGNVYVADTGNHVIRKVTSAGVVTTLAGSGIYGYTDDTGTAAEFERPTGVAVDSSGTIFVADKNNCVIREVTSAGVVSTFAGTGTCEYLDATRTEAKFDSPQDVAVDSSGNVYVQTDGSLNNRVRIISPGGDVSTLAGVLDSIDFEDGPFSSAKFYSADSIAIDDSGDVYVSDWGNRRIRKISSQPYTYTVGGHVAGLGSSNSMILQNNGSDDLVVDANGAFTFTSALDKATDYFVSVNTQPSGQNCVVENGFGMFSIGDILTVDINCATVSTFAGSGVAGYNDATGTSAQFRLASVSVHDSNDIAVDSSNNVYVADTFNHVIRKINPLGVVTTLAGSGSAGYVDDTGTAAQFDSPRGVAIDSSGNVYVGDTSNNVIRKITSGGVVTTLAGSGVGGHTDATGTAAEFYLPTGLDVDSAGNVYVADSRNNVIRKVTSAGVVTTVAGSNLGYVNGDAGVAQFADPYDVAVDDTGNIYVAEANDAIRKISTGGTVSTLAGSHVGYNNSGYIDSTGTGAQFREPVGISVDASGTIYVADHYNHAVRVISPGGTVNTLAGATATAGYVEGNGMSAQFERPSGVAVDVSGNVYVADSQNNVIRKISQ